MKSRLLIFHRTIAPYRIDFFNDLAATFDTRICLQYRNLLSQKFDYEKIVSQFKFTPVYLKTLLQIKGRVINTGYWKQLDEFKPDIVIVGEYGFDCLLVLLHRWLWRKKYKVVSICDDSYNMVAEENDFSQIHRKLRNIIAPKLDELILVEPKVAEWYHRNFGKGIVFPIIKKDEKAREAYRRLLPQSKKTATDYGLNGKYVFLFVGRLVALKNVGNIINAFIQLNRKDTALVIVGDGPEREKMMRFSEQGEVNICFTGRLEGDELWQWYNIADCFVLASYQEAFGAVTNEALLAGCKGLISNKAGSQCLIENGKNGFTFEPTNVSELVMLMKRVMENSLPNAFSTLRPSLMPFTYSTILNNLIQQLIYTIRS